MTRETVSLAVKAILEVLEQNNSDHYGPRTDSYKSMQSLLDKEEIINVEVLQRLLTICIRDINSTTYSACIVNMISTIVSKIKTGTYDPLPDILPSALAVLSLMKKIATFNKVDSLMVLCYRTLLSYPDDILLRVADKHEKIMEILQLYCHIRMPLSPRLETYDFLLKLLQILPTENKRVFVEKGIYIWFSKIIPMVIFDLRGPNAEVQKIMEILELLTDALVHIDYKDNAQWRCVLECICDSKQYPAIMKDLLNAGNNAWYRLWIIFIRLLKQQVTQTHNGIGSPINSMLPVVEIAFKLDAKSRCNAFECWIALIDSFSVHSVESKIAKTMNLLLIPLKANNAKTSEVVLAKFKCWWHLLRKLQSKMDKFHSKVIDSFMKSYFGRYDSLDNTDTVPGLFTDNIKNLYNQAVVEMVGHVNCEGCTELPQLSGKIINTQNLVDNWKQWIYTITSIFKSLSCSYGLTKQQVTCLWKSFIYTIAELPENNVRKDLFNELISHTLELLQNYSCNIQVLDIMFDVLLTIFDDPKMRQLFKSDNNVIIQFVKAISDNSLRMYYKSVDTRELITKLNIITNIIFDEQVCVAECFIEVFLTSLPPNDVGLVIWTALAESLCKKDDTGINHTITSKILIWPLKSMKNFTELKIPALVWYTTYDLMYPKLNEKEIDEELSSYLCDMEDSPLTVYFTLCVLLAILKHKITKNNNIDCAEYLNLLPSLTKVMNRYEDFYEVWPVLVQRIAAIVTIIASDVNETVTATILISLKNVLNILTQTFKNRVDISRVSVLIKDLLAPLDELFSVASYSHLLPNMICDLLKCFTSLSSHIPTRGVRHSIMKKMLAISNVNDENYSKIQCLIGVTGTSKLKRKSEEIKVPLQSPKQVPKRTKNKDANIVDTVVENGEEYVVVKSNWKFNPKKLTENQKEKLQRKREDIPALYQDLSQSQDEFKLVSWKTDSQDTTSSSRSVSKSNKPDNNESATEILKNLSSSNVVPRILENMISESNLSGTNNLLSKNTTKGAETPITTPKNNRTPRMALKDRVFRNMRNLIENSGIHKENDASFEDPNRPVNSVNSTHDSKSERVVHSAPTLLAADRPSRMRRKPKKFDDSLLLTSKKSRSSLQDIHSNNDETNNETAIATPSVVENDYALNHNTISNFDISLTTENIKESDKDQSNEALNNKEKTRDAVEEISNPHTKGSASKKDSHIKSSTVNTNEIDDQSSSHIKEMMQEDKSKNEDTCIYLPSSKELMTKVSTVSPNLIQTSTPKSSKDLRGMSTPNSSINAQVVLTPITPKIVKEMLTSNALETDKGPSTPNISKTITEEVSIFMVPKPKSIAKEIYSEESKAVNDISRTPKTKDSKNISTPNVLIALSDDLTASLNNKDVTLMPTSLKHVKEDSRNKMSTELDAQDVLTSKSNVNHDIEVSTPEQFKESFTPNASADMNELRTPQLSENVVEPSFSTKTIEVKETFDNFSENSVSTPTQSPPSKSTDKKTKTRKTRIEKELAIDMVEGHPFLKKQSERRLTRKALETASVGRRKSTPGKLNKLQSDSNPNPKNAKKAKGRSKEIAIPTSDFHTNENKKKDGESQKSSSLSDDIPCSEDVIESSQDSTITTISVKSSKTISKKIPIVYVEKIQTANNTPIVKNSQSILERVNIEVDQPLCSNQESNDDIVLPLNKTLLETPEDYLMDEKSHENLTANMDTEPLDEKEIIGDIISVSDEVQEVSVTEKCTVGPDTQEIAEADTQPTDLTDVIDMDVSQNITNYSELSITKVGCQSEKSNTESETQGTTVKLVNINTINNKKDKVTDLSCTELEKSNIASSPFKDETQRQQDFLNNTVEISPIKTMSPNRDKTTPSPETSNDYVVITLTSPVQSNGEPFEKCNSPEVFTEDKVSPDKRDQSPPRTEVNLTNTSPSSSLSLKKNKPQVRSGGRAAQMLGLCVPDNVQSFVNSEKDEPEENKKSSMNIAAKRNLRILYNTVNENSDSSNSAGENEDNGNFLKFKRSLPAVDSSPSGSILKRKLAEITDDATISPASKRKRVSFHDPPVSTTISVQKYIEPGVRSPQNSAQKRQERQLRQRTPMKSPKKLENVFKLDTVLTSTVESFRSDTDIADDTQQISLDETPVVEIVKNSDLNDTDPICPDLIDCHESIENIAGELSSPAMKLLLVKELEGKVETISDLAKMTESEVNRLCIKAPKIKVAKQVLLDYARKRSDKVTPLLIDEVKEKSNESMSIVKSFNAEVQTDSVVFMDIGLQTEISSSISSCQTDEVPIAHSSIQTNESGMKSTADLIQSCLSERPDFVEQLGENLEESAIKQLIDRLPITSVTDLLLKKIKPSDVSRILENLCKSNDSSKELSFISDYLCDSDKFAPEDLILFCSELLKSAYSKLRKPSVS